MKKIIILLLSLLFVFSLSVCGGTSLEVATFEGGKDAREKVVDLILYGDVEISENGVVALPDELKNLSDSGECIIVGFEDQTVQKTRNFTIVRTDLI